MSDKYRGYYNRDLEDEFHQGDPGNHELQNELDQREYVVDGEELLTKEQASEREYERDQEEKENARERRKHEREEYEKWNDPYFDSNEGEEPGSPFLGLMFAFLIVVGGIAGILYLLFSGIKM